MRNKDSTSSPNKFQGIEPVEIEPASDFGHENIRKTLSCSGDTKNLILGGWCGTK